VSIFEESGVIVVFPPFVDHILCTFSVPLVLSDNLLYDVI
jgi:hypothetical protein